MFGLILRAYRKEYGISQELLARTLGISRNYLSQIERGIADNISFRLGQRILNLQSKHGKIEVILPRRALIDVEIASEIVWLNWEGVVTRILNCLKWS